MYMNNKDEARAMLETLRVMWATKNAAGKAAIERQAKFILEKWPELAAAPKKAAATKKAAAAPKKAAAVYVAATATSMAFLTHTVSGIRFRIMPAPDAVKVVVTLLKKGVLIITDSQTAVRPIIRPRCPGDWDILKKMRAWLK